MERPASPFADAAKQDAQVPLALLIRRCARREEAALRALYEQSAPQLLSWLVLMLGDGQKADVALPACYRRIWTEASRLAPDTCRPETWLRGMARAAAIDLLREAPAHVGREDLELLLQLVDATSATANAQPAIAKLDAPVARALRLAYVSGATAAELATALGQSARQTRVQLHQGLHALLQPAPVPPAAIHAELLAGAWVLGIQSGRVRRRFQAAAQREPLVRRRLLQWEARLAALGTDPPPVRPDEEAWAAVAGQLQGGGGSQPARRPSRWLWVAALMLAGAMAWALLRTTR